MAIKRVEMGDKPELVKILKRIHGYHNEVAANEASNLYDMNFTKQQACIMVMSGMSSAVGTVLCQFSKVCNVELSNAQLDEFNAEMQSLLNKWVAKIYDAEEASSKLN